MPTYAIEKIEIIRFCKRSRNYTMCVREFESLKKIKNSDNKKGGPIRIRVIPYKK
ncbi:hypothetical protein EV05_1715 [Prochlorococcus sp. MIT 0601]|nr:hypothetical protein EV05_1715 [Prochlorococcus sp. MIT 0601]